jgi:hypothetical protein
VNEENRCASTVSRLSNARIEWAVTNPNWNKNSAQYSCLLQCKVFSSGTRFARLFEWDGAELELNERAETARDHAGTNALQRQPAAIKTSAVLFEMEAKRVN